tara:strand:+ start:1560 stop:2918 length:1359 start_codon:yes stop_codon:yes gene_type:complete
MLPSLSGLSLSVVDTDAKRDRDELDEKDGKFPRVDKEDDMDVEYEMLVTIPKPDRFGSLPDELAKAVVRLFVSGSANIVDVCKAVATWCATSKGACDEETWRYVAVDLLRIDTEPADGNWNGFIAKHCRFLNTTAKSIQPASNIRKRSDYKDSIEMQQTFDRYQAELETFLENQTDDDVDKYELAWKNILVTFPSMLEHTGLKHDERFATWYLKTVEKVRPASTFISFYMLIPDKLKNDFGFAKRYMLDHASVAHYFLVNFEEKLVIFPLNEPSSTTWTFAYMTTDREIVSFSFLKSQEDGTKHAGAEVHEFNMQSESVSGGKIKEYHYTSEKTGFLLQTINFFKGPEDEERLVKIVYIIDDNQRTTEFFKGEKGEEAVVYEVLTFNSGAIATITYDYVEHKKTVSYRDGRRTVEPLAQPEPMDTSARLDRLDRIGSRIPLRPDVDVRSFLN